MCHSGRTSTLKIAVASNLSEPIRLIVDSFQTISDIDVDIILGSSGKLTAQLLNGAPYDVFISAEMNYLDSLYSNNLLIGTPEPFVYGSLVLWIPDNNIDLTLEHLLTDEIRKIAIPNPLTAPYGRAAKETLVNLGYWKTLESKSVFGESVTQTNQFIMTGAVDAGITSLSLIKSPQFNNKGNWMSIDQEFHNPIIHGIGTIKSSANFDDNMKFIQYLNDRYAQSVLSNFGYQLKL